MLTCGTPLVVEGARARVSINGPKRMANYPEHIPSCLYPCLSLPSHHWRQSVDFTRGKKVMNRLIRNFLSCIKELDKSYPHNIYYIIRYKLNAFFWRTTTTQQVWFYHFYSYDFYHIRIANVFQRRPLSVFTSLFLSNLFWNGCFPYREKSRNVCIPFMETFSEITRETVVVIIILHIMI